MKYRIKSGEKYYKDARIYLGGAIIEVPDGYPKSRTFEDIESPKPAASESQAEVPTEASVEAPTKEEPQLKKKKLNLDNF